jgi:hypothetical protein
MKSSYPLAAEARNINFGFLFNRNGKTWFEAAKIELNGV